MKKYLYIYKSELMSNLQYAFDILIGFVSYCIMIFIFLNLWKYIYSDPNELINGYNMNQMIWYVIITEIIYSVIESRKLCYKISDDVKSGNIAYNLNKPYSYIGYIISSHLGLCTIKSILYILLGMTTGYIFLGVFPKINIIEIFLIFITFVLAIIINILLVISIGLIAFFLEDSKPFYWLYSKFTLIFGIIFPLEFFPSWASIILKYSPIYSMCYGPAKLFVDFSYNSFYKVIISQIIYIFISYIICKLIYNKGVKKINVNGG